MGGNEKDRENPERKPFLIHENSSDQHKLAPLQQPEEGISKSGHMKRRKPHHHLISKLLPPPTRPDVGHRNPAKRARFLVKIQPPIHTHTVKQMVARQSPARSFLFPQPRQTNRALPMIDLPFHSTSQSRHILLHHSPQKLVLNHYIPLFGALSQTQCPQDEGHEVLHSCCKWWVQSSARYFENLMRLYELLLPCFCLVRKVRSRGVRPFSNWMWDTSCKAVDLLLWRWTSNSKKIKEKLRGNVKETQPFILLLSWCLSSNGIFSIQLFSARRYASGSRWNNIHQGFPFPLHKCPLLIYVDLLRKQFNDSMPLQLATSLMDLEYQLTQTIDPLISFLINITEH
ncbi:hypothetical protein H6P81_018633 [Aristolochia fimbriata]|uniref:Uncharacterized protein n=1 Tax=Aristolochia fimbriata TaxID=158543 RepID=A0AAV7E3L6_ARIFI|nr:hypothetical protein H6P81_018633 [Aristolochia fimbriata]